MPRQPVDRISRFSSFALPSSASDINLEGKAPRSPPVLPGRPWPRLTLFANVQRSRVWEKRSVGRYRPPVRQDSPVWPVSWAVTSHQVRAETGGWLTALGSDLTGMKGVRSGPFAQSRWARGSVQVATPRAPPGSRLLGSVSRQAALSCPGGFPTAGEVAWPPGGVRVVPREGPKLEAWPRLLLAGCLWSSLRL